MLCLKLILLTDPASRGTSSGNGHSLAGTGGDDFFAPRRSASETVIVEAYEAYAQWKNEGMPANQYLEDYLHGLEFLGGAYPRDAEAIAAHGVVVALDDDDAFEFLLRLVGPAAPPFANELWKLISEFLNSRRAEELFGGSEDAGMTHINAVRRPRYIPPTTRPVIQQ